MNILSNRAVVQWFSDYKKQREQNKDIINKKIPKLYSNITFIIMADKIFIEQMFTNQMNIYKKELGLYLK